MKRYLIVFLTDGEFATMTVMAEDIARALNSFLEGNLQFEEVVLISLCR